jgi:hypothetical protein
LQVGLRFAVRAIQSAPDPGRNRVGKAQCEAGADAYGGTHEGHADRNRQKDKGLPAACIAEARASAADGGDRADQQSTDRDRVVGAVGWHGSRFSRLERSGSPREP